jgi:hypothetical protein
MKPAPTLLVMTLVWLGSPTPLAWADLVPPATRSSIDHDPD